MTVPDDSTTTPSTIDHIDSDDVVEVDLPQPSDPEACLDIGDGVGQSEWTFSPCELGPTSVEVAVAAPPVPARTELPATGAGIAIAALLALTAVGIGVVVRAGTRWT